MTWFYALDGWAAKAYFDFEDAPVIEGEGESVDVVCFLEDLYDSDVQYYAFNDDCPEDGHQSCYWISDATENVNYYVFDCPAEVDFE